MSNEFNCTGGEQNIAQGDNAIGKQENVTQTVIGDDNIFSATGPVTVNQGLRMKPRTVVLASVLAAAVFGGGLAAWYWLAPPPVQKNNIVIKGNNTGTAVIGDHAVVNNTSGVSPEVFAKYAGELAVTDAALASFFKIMQEQKVPRADLDSKLREVAAHYKELLQNWEAVQSADPQIVKLKAEAKQALDAGNYAKAESLLEDIAKHYSTAAAEANADNARLQRVQLRYAKAAAYWQKAAALLLEESKEERAYYLHSAAFDLDRIGKYTEALSLYEQSLAIRQEIGNKAGDAVTLNNIAGIYRVRGEYDKALPLFEQSLAISRELGDRKGEGVTLNNISLIYQARRDYAKSLPLYEQSLAISREIGDKADEGTTLNNIAGIYEAWGYYATALKYLEQSLAISREIGDKKVEGWALHNIGGIQSAQGDYAVALKYLEQSLSISQKLSNKAGEAMTSWTIGRAYEDQGDLKQAEAYMSRAVQLMEELGHPDFEQERKDLERVRAKLRGR